MQIHAPTPVLSTQPMSPPLPSGTRSRSRSRARSSSRPSSPLTSSVPLPQRPPMPRPPSRSERLLRDTLRRAEEQERLLNPTPSLFGLSPSVPNPNLPAAHMFGPCRLPAAAHGGRRHRRNTSSSVQSDSSCDYFDGEVLDEESPEDEEDNVWPWRADGAASSSSNSSGHGHHPTRVVSYGRADSVLPVPPSPARVQLQRAAKSSPSVPRRHSHSQSLTHPPSRASIDAEHSITPHEAVLRSRLEGVLKNAKVQDRRPRSVERQDPESGFSSGSGNSMASSRNLSGEGDFFFGASGDVSITVSYTLGGADPPWTFIQSNLTSLKPNEARHKLVASATSSPRRDQRHLYMAPSTSPRSAHKHLSSQKSGSSGNASPLTPPPSPPFNARVAAAQCRTMDGYISFANIEGLGVPDGSDEETDEDAKSRSRWFQWLHLSGKNAIHDRTRGRSESASSASR